MEKAAAYSSHHLQYEHPEIEDCQGTSPYPTLSNERSSREGKYLISYGLPRLNCGITKSLPSWQAGCPLS